MTSPTRLTDRARLAWHVAGSLRDFWSSDLNRAAVELIDPQPGEVVLDLGAGLGPASIEAAPLVGSRGGRVIAVDPSGTMRGVLRLRCLARSRLGAIEVRAGTAEALPVDACSVDALLAVNATHHFADLDRFAAELARVLRPSGRVVLVEEDLSHPDHTFARVAGDGHHGPHALDVDALMARFASAGLTDASSTYRTVAGTPATVITIGKPA